jgi:hypothetical protein
MKSHLAALAAGFLLASSVAVSAHASDTSYCTDMSGLYARYVADPSVGRNRTQPPADVATAQSRCSSDPGSAIPVLEKALTDARISLPAR